jgi:hypothetical protein
MARPWRGERWAQSDNPLGGLRIMILGESHYHGEAPIGTDVPDMTEHVISSYLSDTTSVPFLSKIERLVMGDRAPWEPRDFWDSVVFYNYIPVVAANKPRQRPPEELWHGVAPRLFGEVVKRVEAEAILVCGVDLWRRMPIGLIERHDAYQAGGRGWREREYEVAMPHRAVAAHIPHPSSWGWRFERSEPVIRHLRTRVNDIRKEIGVDLLPTSAVVGDYSTT